MVRRRYRRKHHKQLTDIPLTPLIDTALTLLVIFMIATPMIHNAIRVTLPKGKAKEDHGEQQELVVYIDKESKIYFNGAQVQSNQLISELQKKVSESDKKSVYIKADVDALCGRVFELIDQLKMTNGIQSVIFSTQKCT